MPGIAIIGDSRNAERNRPTSLPAEARSLARMLRLLKSPKAAATALSESVSTLPLPSDSGQKTALQQIRKHVTLCIEDLKEAGWGDVGSRYPEYNLSMAVESVLQDSASFRNPGKSASKNNRPSPQTKADNCRFEESSDVFPTKNMGSFSGSGSVSSFDSPDKDSPQKTAQNPNSARRSSSVAIVSDSSSVEEESLTTALSEGRQAVTKTSTTTATTTTTTALVDEDEDDNDMQAAKSARHLWALILESVHLQVASRTTTVWGKKKIYEVYQLARPVQDLAIREELLIQKRLEEESRSVFDGILLDVNRSSCRIYTTFQPLSGCDRPIPALHVQINLGKMLDLQDESNRAPSGEKKKKKEGEFVAILVPGSSLFALTASRAASRCRYTPYVLALLENVLTETTNNCAAIKATKKKSDMEDIAAKRFEDLSGTEPHELLRAARSVAVGEATGRFAFMASTDRSNPVKDLRTAATENLLGQTQQSLEASKGGAATVVGATRRGDNVWLDHSSQEKESRKRSREQALGRNKDCPKQIQRLCWKWAGETTAASACWMDEDDKQNETKNMGELPKTEFKCAVVMKGENVLQGIQALVDAGLMEAPLPDFIRDAPSLGGTIRVNHGSFSTADPSLEREA